nr:G protein-coupled receptor [Proales similis]
MKESLIGFIFYMSVLFVFGTLFNLVIILANCSRYKLNSFLFLLFSLAWVDFLTSLLVVPFSLLVSGNLVYLDNRLFCGAAYFARYFTTSISVLLLALISYERYQIISSKNLSSLRLLQNGMYRRTKFSVLSIVALSFVFSVWSFYFYYNDGEECEEKPETIYFNILSTFMLGLVVLFMIALYVKTYLVVRKSVHRVLSSQSSNQQSSHKHVASAEPKAVQRRHQVISTILEKNEFNMDPQNDCALKSNYGAVKPFARANTLDQIQRKEIQQSEVTDQTATVQSIEIKPICEACGNAARAELVKPRTMSNQINEPIRMESSRLMIRKDWRVAQVFFLITVLFILTWIPWLITSLQLVPENNILFNSYLLNNVLNPVMYSFLSKRFRSELLKTARKTMRRFFLF